MAKENEEENLTFCTFITIHSPLIYHLEYIVRLKGINLSIKSAKSFDLLKLFSDNKKIPSLHIHTVDPSTVWGLGHQLPLQSETLV